MSSTVKNILIGLVVILVIAGIGIYFLPNHYAVTRSVEINRPAPAIYSMLADFTQWNAWDPWHEKEPTAKTTLEGAPGAIGQKRSWDGEKLGAGSMMLSWVKENEEVKTDLDFQKPMKAQAKSDFKLEPMGDKTKVTWTTSGGLSYPLGRLFGLSMDKMLGGDQEHGLDNLKKLVEAMPAPPVAAVDSSAGAKPM